MMKMIAITGLLEQSAEWYSWGMVKRVYYILSPLPLLIFVAIELIGSLLTKIEVPRGSVHAH